MWELKYDRSVPPLPEPVGEDLPRRKKGLEDFLPLGCWVVQLEPLLHDDQERAKSWLLYYRGTFRLSLASDLRKKAAGVLGSGDLYLKQQKWDETEGAPDVAPPARPQLPRPPIWPRNEYRFYFRLTHLARNQHGRPVLELDTYRVDPRTGEWHASGRLGGELHRAGAKTWKDRYLEGELQNERGTPVARLKIGWFSELLRRATVEIDSTRGLKPLPTNANRRGDKTLESTFAEYGWELNVELGDKNVPAPDDGVWGDGPLHAQMLKSRKGVDFDSEWRYHVLIVERACRHTVLCFGAMYDEGAIDSNLVPREGLAIAAGSGFPSSSLYKEVAGKRLEDEPEAYLRTAVHELGHAMGLSHYYRGREFMQATDHIAESPVGVFPYNILWRFSRADVVRLKHLPDPWVRPGGLPFEVNQTRVPVPIEDLTSDVSDSLKLFVTPLAPSFPLGAPVRIHLRLENQTSKALPGPKSISLSEGSVAGEVTSPGGVAHPFATAKHFGGPGWAQMSPLAVIENDLVLVRGPRGSLFATPGTYEIAVQVSWLAPSGIARTTANTAVLITWPSVADEPAALAVLTSPEIVIPLIFRSKPDLMAEGDRRKLERGLAALRLALQAPGLSPHWAAVEARYRAENEPKDVPAVAELFQQRVVMTAAEVNDVLVILEKAALAAPLRPAVARMLLVLDATVNELSGLCPKEVAAKLAALLAKVGIEH